ncbi:MAG: sulfatase, partial [Pirellulales bacterium]
MMIRTAVASFLLAAIAPLATADDEVAVDRTSFVVLVTDDQRWDTLGCTGHSVLRTPNIDRLAAGGVLFRNAFVTTSICCISRASLMTGRYARSHGVADFQTALAPELLAATYPALLHQAGYRTGCLGKWGIGGPAPEGVFDVWQAWGGQGEFFETIDGQEVHNSELLARGAVDFLKTVSKDQPFCLVVNYKSPHEPFLPDPRDAPLFAENGFPVPATYNQAHFEALPAFIRESEGRIRLDRRHPTPDTYQEFVRQYLRCLAGVDRSVGKILDVLDELRLADQTVVVYTSDHGFFLGEHGLSGKWLMHEESIRVPLIVRDPALPAERRGKTSDELVLNLDLAPTIVDLAGLPLPAGTDGASLRPLLAGEQADWRQDFFYEHHFHYGGRIPRTEGVRTKDWKYITYFDVEPAHEELYDLAHDPIEERNLAGDPAFDDRLDDMRRLYRQYL